MGKLNVGRVKLAHLPTPLEPLDRLSRHLGGPRIFVKRDDQTGLALGGNKARKLEFLLAEALETGCDTLVTTGGQQSNHARQTAAAAAKFGLHCELILPRWVPNSTKEYERSGNVLLDRLLGAEVEMPSAQGFSQADLDGRVKQLKDEGRRPYFIPVGGSTALGAVGYVEAVDELLAQARQMNINIDAIAIPTGSAGTHGGVLAGLVRALHPARLQGYAVSGTTADKEALVRSLAEGALGCLGVLDDGGECVAEIAARAKVDDRYVGPGYGLPTEAMIEAVRLLAELEGLLLDPVYTGKAMAGLIAAIRGGEFKTDETVVFWHTGGTPALFAYADIF